jgi:hypothetical protein
MVYLNPAPSLKDTQPASIDTVLLEPPQTFPPAGSYQAQVTIAPWHPLSEAIFEQAPSAAGPWTQVSSDIVLDSTATLWLRARVANRFVSQPQSFAYKIQPALVADTILPLVSNAPTGLLYAFVPDSVTKIGDAIHVYALVQGCTGDTAQGFRGWVHADSLALFRQPCTLQTSPTRFDLVLPGSASIDIAYTLQPLDMFFPLP